MYKPFLNPTDSRMLSMQQQNDELMHFHNVMIEENKETTTMQQASDLNRWAIDDTISTTFNNLKILSDPNAKSDPAGDLRIFERGLERLEDHLQAGHLMNRALTTHQQKAQHTLLQYHAHVKDILVHTTAICAENLELIRTGQLTKKEMEELHVAMKRMVDEHAHNVTTPRQATPSRRGFFGTRTDVQSSEDYKI